MLNAFSYHEAFSRNIGWVTVQEQNILRHKRIAIAGLGGVGGAHFLTLARLGVGFFRVADFDEFSLANFNRQVGANISSLGKPKTDVLVAMAKDINPDIDIEIFPEGINKDNLREFLADIDVYVDGLDFFVFSDRQATFSACAELGIPAITAAPLGMGAALLNFMPGKMTFEEYFQWGDLPEEEKALRFLVGLAPNGLHAKYLVDPATINFREHRGPSTMMGCQLCAGIVATEALKILLNRGRVFAAPHVIHFDAYRNKLKHSWRPGGNSNPLQRMILAIARRRLDTKSAADNKSSQQPGTGNEVLSDPLPDRITSKPVIDQILDLARWAPSGDNTQPWRFEVVDEHHVVVHGFDTRDDCVYDLDGHASQIAIGALLETMDIAATAHGLRMNALRRMEAPESRPIIDVHFQPDPDLRPSKLIPYITYRSVQRRSMSSRPLSPREKDRLEKALDSSSDSSYRILWLEGFDARMKAARLMFNNAKLRLTMPEAYEVHRRIIQWNSRFSEDKVPDQSLGIDPVTARLMHWVLGSWERVRFFNRFLAGTLAPRIQMDFIPGLACGAHFVILGERPAESIDDYIDAGRAVQRFWLTATRLGLQLQPEITPLIFSRYVRSGLEFTKVKKLDQFARTLSGQTERLIGKEETTQAVFMGRIGAGPASWSRSLRLPLGRLNSSWNNSREPENS
ncbi:MAG TPA: ThiF family adenylyltransferase [Nitrosospira sp.]|nr:ThiF family adenylyltransferase [Nitrosospira sp.]